LHKFSIAPAAKLLVGSEKVRRCKNGTDFIYHVEKFGGIVPSLPGSRRKKV